MGDLEFLEYESILVQFRRQLINIVLVVTPHERQFLVQETTASGEHMMPPPDGAQDTPYAS